MGTESVGVSHSWMRVPKDGMRVNQSSVEKRLPYISALYEVYYFGNDKEKALLEQLIRTVTAYSRIQGSQVSAIKVIEGSLHRLGRLKRILLMNASLILFSVL